MSIEVLPGGAGCNLDCDYCYERKQREPAAPIVRYNGAVLKPMLEVISDGWTLFGGEPLLVPLKDLEELLEIGFRRTGQTGIQTNGSIITPRHIDLFIKYNTHPGISMDGPDALNDARWAGTLEGTRKMTRRSEAAVRELARISRERNVPRLMPSLIINLHRLNAAPDRLPMLKAWLRELAGLGLWSARFHVLDPDYKYDSVALTEDDAIAALLELWRMQDEFIDAGLSLHFDKFSDVLASLSGATPDSCTWRVCDPWNTAAVEGLNGDGTPTQCGRSGSNDGLDWVPCEGDGKPTKSRSSGAVGVRFHERQLALYVTPQEHGGCQGCRFWMMCYGQCPGSGKPSAADSWGDWRYRSIHCGVFKALFAEGERRLMAVGQTPVSRWANREEMELLQYRGWAQGKEIDIGPLVAHMTNPREPVEQLGTQLDGHQNIPHGNEHGNHTNLAAGRAAQPHSNVPHGNEHGNHTNYAMVRP